MAIQIPILIYLYRLHHSFFMMEVFYLLYCVMMHHACKPPTKLPP